MQLIIFIFVEKNEFFVSTYKEKRCSQASPFKVGSSLSFSNLAVFEIISWIVTLSKVSKYGPEKTPYLDTFHAVSIIEKFSM